MNTIGERFREIRKYFGKTQLQFAELFDLSDETISMIERDKILPTAKILLKLEEMGINSRWLLINQGSMKSSEIDKSENAKMTYEEMLPILNELKNIEPGEKMKVIDFLKGIK